MYLEVPVREIATGVPLIEPILTAAPTLLKAGTDFRSTDKRPPDIFFTAEFASAGIPEAPSATMAQAPENRVRLEIGCIKNYFLLIFE
jgi:hypothetical protein